MNPERIESSFTPVTACDVVWVELDGEAVLYHETLNTVHVLNPTATIIWKCLDGSTELEALSAELAELFSEDLDAVRTDVVEAVRTFGRQGLLEGIESVPEAVAENALESDPKGRSTDG